MEDNLIPLSQIREKLGITDRTLNRWIKEGRIQIVRLARTKRFVRQEDLDDFIKQHTGVYKR